MPHLRTLRRSRELTILEVAQRSGLTARTIAELEYGLRPLEDTARLSLARSYDLAPEDLEISLAAPVSLPWEYLAKILSRQLILATLISTLMVTLLFGGAIYGAESHTPLASERPVAQVDGLGSRLSTRYVLAPTTTSRRRPNTRLRPQVMDSPILAVSPTLTPTATLRPLPIATPQPASPSVLNLLLTDAPSPVSSAAFQFTSTEMPSPAPPEVPSPMPVAASSPISPEVPNSAPPDTPTLAPPEVPNPSGRAMPQNNSVLMPLPADGSFRHNVVAALEANNGALQHVVIPPNAVWSFNRTVGDPDLLQLEPVYGVYGGGWCDLASRYTMVLRPLLPPESFEFIRHIDATGFGLEGVPDEDAAVIWNSNGADDEQDLRIHNPSDRTISIHVTLVADGVQFQATIQ